MAATDPHTSSTEAPAANARATWARSDAAGAPSATRVAIRTSSISRSSRELPASPATRASRRAEIRPGTVSRPSSSAGTAIGVGSGTPGTISNAIRAGGKCAGAAIRPLPGPLPRSELGGRVDVGFSVASGGTAGDNVPA